MAMKELREALHFACTVEFWRMAVLWTLSIILSYLHLFAQTFLSPNSGSYPRCSPRPVPPPGTSSSAAPAHGRPVCVITGATSGLGAAAADALSREGFFVVLGRSSHLLSKAISNIRKRNRGADLKAFEVDLSSFQSILNFKDSLQQWLLDSDMHSSIQLLINNAGILAASGRSTAEGNDMMMGTNYIAAFCLTKVLLPLLENSPAPSRIVNVTSFTHRNVFDIQVDKATVSGKLFSKLECYPYAHIYEYSKACLLLFSYELHRQFVLVGKSHQVSVSAADPGIVKTNIMREIPSCLSQVAFLVLKLLGLLQSPENGVHSILDAALAPAGTSGVYFFGGNGRTIKSSALSYDTKLSKELWATSCNLFFELQLSSEETST
ncbi:short-chain dehydrogenase TIC 32, chloroplastic-like isoform X2 [Cornus florida]|uniref:short-chain dehydrogenase TIC 32, chloroplastic-like isoform X2 n=1 Tax=Cornus florida TaxID=4283 RepID=UPI0028A1C18C|nr:short-chain dehydrogenase TIC 32, chloroplastic-like isoform X2 [Cornus florida]